MAKWPELCNAKEKAKSISNEIESLIKRHNSLFKKELASHSQQFGEEMDEMIEKIKEDSKEMIKDLEEHKKQLLARSKFLGRHNSRYKK